MKKTLIFKYFALFLIVGIMSCGSDETPDFLPAGPTVTSITLSANSTTLFEGESATFNVVDNLGNNITSESIITIDGVVVTDNPYVFTTAGTYVVVVTNGDFESTINIVVEAVPVPTAIILTVNPTTLFAGESATFTVMDDLGNNVTSIATFTANGVTVTSPYTFPTAGNVDVIASFSGLTSNTVSVTVNAPSTRMFTTKILLSDHTGEWCGACPTAGVKVHDATAANPNVLAIAYHNGDSMANSDATTVENAFNISGFPTVNINGKAGEWSWSNFPSSELNPFINATQQTGLAINSTVNGNNLDITVKVGFANIADTNLKLTVWLLEDGKSGTQSNYYEPGGNPLYNYEHNDIARKAYTAPMGDVIPAGSIVVDADYTKTFTGVAIPGGVNTANLRILAFVSDAADNILNVQTAGTGVNKDFD